MKTVALAVAVLAVACAAAEPPPYEAAWVGALTTEGDVTTVVNQSGSVWRGTATLVEEASIGVESGADAYMLGSVRGVAASAEHIYLLDSQIPALRAYDLGGMHVADFGREGEGPGEFRRPQAIGIDDRGTVWLHDRRGVLLAFSPEGETLATVTIQGMAISGAATMVVTPEGTAFILDAAFPETPSADSSEVRVGMSPYGLTGAAGAMIEFPSFGDSAYLTAESSVEMRFVGVPFHPNGVTVFTPSRTMLNGDGATYRFEIVRPEGTRTVVERVADPVAVAVEEAAAHRRGATAYLREIDPDWVWNEADIPATKPAFNALVPTQGGQVWAVRSGAGTAIAGCDEDSFEPDPDRLAPCWAEPRIVDVFGAEGRYLGALSVPDEFRFDPLPFIRGDTVVARAEDEAGTIMVKRYRLVLPGAE